MPELLFILAPARSFSSIISTMIGEHPQLYGFPELHLFNGDTVEQVLAHQRTRRIKLGPFGLLRTLAQLHDGIQTTGTILKATAWLHERRDWPTKKLYDYLLERVNPLMGVEKSPETGSQSVFLERAYAQFPNAYFLHLTRHPVSSANSMQEFFEENWGLDKGKHYMLFWYKVHTNIMNFTHHLPAGQTMRIKGESLLSQPDVYLPQIAQWLGLQSDTEAIEAMKHPENSPYAFVGPDPAPGGNDGKFMRSPYLRQGTIKEPCLQDYLHKFSPNWVDENVRGRYFEGGLELLPNADINDEILRLAHLMGYN